MPEVGPPRFTIPRCPRVLPLTDKALAMLQAVRSERPLTLTGAHRGLRTASASKEVAKAADPHLRMLELRPVSRHRTMSPSFEARAQENGALAPQDEGFAATYQPEDR